MDPQGESSTTPAPVSPTPAPEPAKKDSHGITIAALAIFILLSLAAVAFLYYQNQQLKTMLANYQTTPVPTATPDVTANWKTYTNLQEGFSFKYPPAWSESTSSAKIANGKEFRIETDKGEFINGTVFNEPDSTFNEQAWSKQIKLNDGKALVITYTNSLGPDAKGGTADIAIFDQILSTFKFTEASATPSSSLLPSSLPQ